MQPGRLEPAFQEGGDVRGRVPRKVDCDITGPSTTGRSLFAPSPLLSMPVVALNGRAEASCSTSGSDVVGSR